MCVCNCHMLIDMQWLQVAVPAVLSCTVNVQAVVQTSAITANNDGMPVRLVQQHVPSVCLAFTLYILLSVTVWTLILAALLLVCTLFLFVGIRTSGQSNLAMVASHSVSSQLSRQNFLSPSLLSRAPLPLLIGGSGHPSNMMFFGPTPHSSLYPVQDLDPFSHYCMVQVHDKQTDLETHHTWEHCPQFSLIMLSNK